MARYWLANYGVTFESIPMAYDIFRLTKGTRVVTDSAVPLNSHPNGSRVLPPKGSLLIWGKGKAGTTFQTTGHVAVVVNAGPSFVDIVEQNVYDGHICAGTGAHPATSATGLGLAPATSASGLGSPLQNLRRDLGSPLATWTGAQPCPRRHSYWGSPLPMSAPGLGSPLPASAPGLGSRLSHLHRDSG